MIDEKEKVERRKQEIGRTNGRETETKKRERGRKWEWE